MSIVPTWPISAICLAVGVAGGAVSTRYVYVNKIEKIQAQHIELLRQREVKRADDERAARAKEQGWVERVNEAEQRRINETDRISRERDAAITSLQNRASRKPASTGSLPSPATSCQGSTGAELSRADAEFSLRLAARADEQREALRACYSAYDSLSP